MPGARHRPASAAARAQDERGETKMTESELLELGERLERVERSVRRYRAALGIAGLLLAVGLLSTSGFFATGHARASTSAPAQIVARSFVLVDANGRTRAKLWIDPRGPALALYDKAENPRVGLYVAEHGPTLQLDDKAGKARVGLYVAEHGPTLQLYDKAEKIRAVLGTTELEKTATGSTETRAESSLVLFNQRGRVLWEAP
jgi:hypothetical protein